MVSVVANNGSLHKNLMTAGKPQAWWSGSSQPHSLKAASPRVRRPSGDYSDSHFYPFLTWRAMRRVASPLTAAPDRARWSIELLSQPLLPGWGGGGVPELL